MAVVCLYSSSGPSGQLVLLILRQLLRILSCVQKLLGLLSQRPEMGHFGKARHNWDCLKMISKLFLVTRLAATASAFCTGTVMFPLSKMSTISIAITLVLSIS